MIILGGLLGYCKQEICILGLYKIHSDLHAKWKKEKKKQNKKKTNKQLSQLCK